MRHNHHLIFFLLTQPPPRSTLFPYTTLFRSSLILHLGNLLLIVQLHFSKLFLILKSGVNHTSRSEERFSRNAETDLVCRLLLEKKKYYKRCLLCSMVVGTNMQHFADHAFILY